MLKNLNWRGSVILWIWTHSCTDPSTHNHTWDTSSDNSTRQPFEVKATPALSPRPPGICPLSWYRLFVLQLLSRVWLFVTSWTVRLLGPPPSPGVCSNSRPLSWLPFPEWHAVNKWSQAPYASGDWPLLQTVMLSLRVIHAIVDITSLLLLSLSSSPLRGCSMV